MTVDDLAIAKAACQLLVEQIPTLVPVTTLHGSVTAGASAVIVHTPTGFLPGNLVIWLDGSGEEPLPVLSVEGDLITFDFSGNDHTALQVDHADGATIATNVLDDLPLDESDERRNGYPTISCFVIRKKTPLSAVQGLRQALPVLQIVYQLTSKQAAGSPLHPRLWLRQQSHRAVTDVAGIVSALYDHSELITTQNTALIQEITAIDQNTKVFIGSDGSYHYQIPIQAQLVGGYTAIGP